MKPVKIELFHAATPLKSKIKHASHERSISDDLIVAVTLADGSMGYGEGVPRTYVTGDTIESSMNVLESFNLAEHMGSPRTFAEAVARIGAMEFPVTLADPRGMTGNPARCALELAALDAYARSFGESLGTAVELFANRLDADLTRPPARVRYSGAITAETKRKETISAIKMWLYNFAQVKVKVGVTGQDDPARMRKFRRILGSRIDIRIDANESWSADEVVDRVEPLLRYKPSALEQPVAHGEVERLAELRPRLGVPVMLDESLCGYPDAEKAARLGLADFFNVRLSKCGGIAPVLKIVELARRRGIGLQLGCHPGETGILSAAGRHVASRIGAFRYVEGSYDKHILLQNITRPDITFRFGGWAKPIGGSGLGVEVDRDALESLTVTRSEAFYD